ncbi:LysR family transcriptional regulator [Serratia sp. AKBS12]|uniref:LysR family transcriptional regulator n=1 Tax=Serratia sp. AKBS12 TaxID=2974597 RepID=UPI0021668C72|nr:LysR family transcriptional regulator [Serratia sp. AKBS12]MCS3408676.1 LysR family transcriptional regulator [Serratia sp. AKBS12]HEI8865014.1 LysR family transcriptional regulator [Serratia odorifera]
MDKLAAMQTFIRVVESGAFSRAATLLDLPKSTVTRQIQALEQQLNITLLHRTSRRLTLTEQGRAYYLGAVQWLEQLRQFEGGVIGAGQAPSGVIHVSMPHTLAYHKVIPHLADFYRRYPDIQLTLNLANHAIDPIEAQVDCVVRIGALMNDALIARSLGTLERITCASPDYLQRHGTPMHPNALRRDHQMIHVVSPQSGKPFIHQLLRQDERVTLDGDWLFAVNDANAALHAARAGLGVVTTYRFLAEEALRRGELVTILPDWQCEPAAVHIAWPENRHLASKVRYFIDWIRELFNR